MPVHRVPVDDHESPSAALEAAVVRIEANGEQVTQVVPTGSAWVVLTVKETKRQTRVKKPRETR